MRCGLVVLITLACTGCQMTPEQSARLQNVGVALASMQPAQPVAPAPPPPFWVTQPQPVYIAPAPGQQLNTYLAQHR